MILTLIQGNDKTNGKYLGQGDVSQHMMYPTKHGNFPLAIATSMA